MLIFTFNSDYAEEDIVYTLEEIFQNILVTHTAIIFREQLRPQSAEYKFTVELTLDPEKRDSFIDPRCFLCKKMWFEI